MYVGEWNAMKKEGRSDDFPTMDDLLLLSDGGAHYTWMCAKFIPFVVGFKHWNRFYRTQKLSKLATCSDESFLLLVLENNYERWVDEAEWLETNKDKPMAERAPKHWAAAKYTNSGKSQSNGRCRPCQGWSNEGYKRFNALHKLVKADRKGREEFEQEFFEECQAKASRKAKDIMVEEEIYPANDLWDDGDRADEEPNKERMENTYSDYDE